MVFIVVVGIGGGLALSSCIKATGLDQPTPGLKTTGQHERFREGRWAHENGIPILANPYSGWRAKDWQEGWVSCPSN